MALNYTTNITFDGRVTAADASYPYSSSKDESSPGANDGMPHIKQRADDLLGWQQALLTEAAIVPSGNAETALVSDYLDAMKKILKTGRKNSIFNGGFDIWQRAITQTSDGYGSDDRWLNSNTGSTKVHTQQTFTLGQTDVPGNPKFYSRTVVTSVAGASNLCAKRQHIEGVAKHSGEPIVVSFWAKADAAKDIASELVQSFGTGGSPSADVTALGVTTHSLTTSWAKFTVTATLPSVSGKTLGTGDDDYLELGFWFDAGSSFDARTNTLGQQSGTFEIAQVQLEPGTVATDFEQRAIGDELVLCQRYFEKSYNLSDAPGSSVNQGSVQFESANATSREHSNSVKFSTRKRGTPTVVVYSATGASGNWRNSSTSADLGAIATIPSEQAFTSNASPAAAITVGNDIRYQWTADAEL